MPKTNEAVTADNKALVGIALKSKKDILGMISQVADHGKSFMALLHDTAVQVMLHVQKHHDTTMVDKLFTAIPPGVMVAGLKKWYTDNTPIRLTTEKLEDGTFVHTATELKPNDPDYGKGYQTEKAAAAQFGQDRATAAVANRTIEPWSVKMLYDRIGSIEAQILKSKDQGGRGIASGENMVVLQACIARMKSDVGHFMALQAGDKKAARREAMEIVDTQPGARSTKLEGEIIKSIKGKKRGRKADVAQAEAA